MSNVRWGIVGTGGMARAMTKALQARPDATVVAVASEDWGRAKTFADSYGLDHAHGSHDGIASDPEVDVVYVASTNEKHLANTLACVTAGKAVMCEKPLGLNNIEVTQMAAAARKSSVFLMEAMWMRFQPFLGKVTNLIAVGAIGTVRQLTAEFCIPLPYATDNRWFDPRLGGGSLLDVGIYPVTLAHHLLGDPLYWSATAQLAPTGVDAQVGIVSSHEGETLAVLAIGFVADGSGEATIAGTEGRIRIHKPFHHSPKVTLHRRNELVETYDTSYEGSGLQFEVDEVHRCLAAGLVESEGMPLRDSLAIASWMTEIRRRCGISYPGEEVAGP